MKRITQINSVNYTRSFKSTIYFLLRLLNLRGLSLFIVIIFASPALAKTNLPLPRFVSIKSNEANIRTGPSVRYPIRWVFVKKGEPVELMAEFEHWRKIRDKQGDEGWIHESMLSGKRTVIIIGDKLQRVYARPSLNSQAICLIEPEVRAVVTICEKEWCRITTEDFNGWIEKKHIWGVYSNEDFE